MAYDVNIRRIGSCAVIDLQGDAQAIVDWVGSELPPLPQQPNRFTRSGTLQLCWIGPERWLLRADLDQEQRLLAMTRPGAAPLEISIVQVSDTLCFFELDGAEASDIVSIACPIDHHPAAFPQDGVSYTSIFGVKGLLGRSANGFEIAVESSFADMIEDYLARANR